MGKHTIVIGAGITGLTAATTLRASGHNVTVLEASERPGGRIQRLTHQGDSVEAGAQGIHSNYTEMLGLISKAGLSGDLMPLDGKVSYLDRDGTPRVPNGNLGITSLMNARGIRDLTWFLTRYLALAKRYPQFEITRDLPAYDNISVQDALSWAGSDFRDYILRPMMHGMTNTTLEHTNLYHMLNSSKLALTTKVFGLRTGIVTLAERLASKLSIRYGCPALQILSSGRRVDGVLLESGEVIKCDHVIVACPIEAAARMLPSEMGPATEFLSNFNNTPIVLVYFFLDRPLASPAYVYMGHPFRDVTFNMAINHSRKTPYMAPSGKAIISAWSCYPNSALLSSQSDDAIIHQALNDMEAFVPEIASWVEEARLVRHSWGTARYAPGTHRKILDFKRYTETLQGISFASNDFDGVHMESGIRSAQRAARRAEQA
ncbi:TPA: NAD(P)/FAD-dependent oxidoreductase [Pseudomonas aeruginosa]